VKISYLTKR